MEQSDPSLNLCSSCQNQIAADHKFCAVCGQQQNLTDLQDSSQKWQKFKEIALFFTILLLFCVCSYLVPEKSITIELLFDVAMAITTVAFFGYNWPENQPLIKWPGFSFKKLALFAVLAVMTSLIVQFLAGHLNQIIFDRNSSYYTLYKPHKYGAYLMVVSIALFPAIFEELAFRGYLMQKLLSIVDEKEAVYISSILFFFMHFSMISFFWLLPFAIILGQIRLREKTIWYGVAIHFFFNLTACLWDIILT